MLKRLLKSVLTLAAVLAGLSLTGCASYVTSNVAAFAAWNDASGARTYAYRRSPAERDSIEEQTYERLVDAELARYGFRRVPPERARYLVSLAYGVSTRTVVVNQPVFYDPWTAPWGPWGGPFFPGWYPAGPAGYVPQAYPEAVRRLSVRIVQRDTGQERYQVTATNAGGNAPLVMAMPYLVRSALADFPLQNGTVRRVRVPFEKPLANPPAETTVPPPGPATPATPAAASAVPAAQ
jgi:hypothetical protein